MIDQNGSLWICGDNWCGQLGNGVPGGKNAVNFVKVMDNIVSASCGGRFAAAIKSNGGLWMWGDNSYGQLGNNGKANAIMDEANRYQTEPVKVMDGVAVVHCSSRQSAAIKTDGTLWTWGEISLLSNKANPVKVMDGVASVSGNMILKTDGTLLRIEDKTSFETFLSLGPVHIRPNTHLSGKFCRLRR